MPSFDVVSEFEKQELTNAINQANRELETRFDFKKIKAKFELDECNVVMRAEVDFQLKQMQDILESKLVKRGIDIMCMDVGEVESNVAEARVTVSMRQGLDKDIAKKVVKLIKESKTKVQSAIQGEKVRVTGKKRDDLQKPISLLKEADFNIPLQFNNFRD
ncbi:MAG: YajQ family cyclic di-GMP-binding protein [Pseudomonadales bacterium]|nr:YajQ family cyclic di-GMP-binding protein [Pseudomonadales bacterium]